MLLLNKLNSISFSLEKDEPTT